MRHHRGSKTLLTAVVALVLVWGAAYAIGESRGQGTGAAGGEGENTYAPGEVLVKYRSGMGAAALASQRLRMGVQGIREFADRDIRHLRLPAGMSVRGALEVLRQDPGVEYAEPNYYRFIARTPDDPSYPALWGLHRISAPQAWDETTDCTAVVVAVVDTGADYEHPDLAANIWTNPGETPNDGADNDGNGYIDDVVGWDFVFGDGRPVDADGHGTHVAGTLAAAGNNLRGVVGVCWSARVVVLRAFDAIGIGTVADILDAMEYARRSGARIVNASYAGPSFSQAERDGISALDSAGILLVAAAGNEGADSDLTPSYPAGYDLPNVIAVAASDTADRLAGFSNYGRDSVAVAAPGSGIYSTYPPEASALYEGFESGTAGWALQSPIGRAIPGFGSPWALADSPGGDYVPNLDASATSPALDLRSRRAARLDFVFRGQMLAGDALYVETAETIAGPWTPRRVWVQDPGSGAWQAFDSGVFGNFSSAWRPAEVDLDPLDGLPAAHFRFRFRSDATGTAEGFSLDEVVVAALEAGQDTYAYLSGTSMAAPHVSGLAALVWSRNPQFTAAETRARLLDSVDRLPGLQGRVFTAGRINADRSLRNIPAPPSGFAVTQTSPARIGLAWDDNYSAAVGVRIERSDGGGAFVEIASLAPGAAAFQDTSVQANRTYAYRAAAFNSENVSTYTETLSATAASPPSGGGGGGGGGGCFLSALAGGHDSRE